MAHSMKPSNSALEAKVSRVKVQEVGDKALLLLKCA